MLRGLTDDIIPVLFKISGLNSAGKNYFKLDDYNYSIYPEEKELLLRDGFKF